MESKFIKRTTIFLRIYFIFNSVGLFCLFIYFLLLGFVGVIETLNDNNSEEIIVFLVFGLCSIIPIALLGINIFAAFKVKQRTKNTWILMLVLVCFGLITPYTILPAIFILVSLLDEEVRKYYKLGEKQESDEIKLV